MENPSVEHRNPSTPKFYDGDDVVSDLVCVRITKDDTVKAVNTLSSAAAHRSNPLQFSVRMISGGSTMVMQAYPEETVQSILERIETLKRIPISEQRLIFMGKQLQREQTLAECSIQNGVNLQLVCRMRPTGHPQAWQVINDMVSVVLKLYHGGVVPGAVKTIKGFITTYLNMAPRIDDKDSASGYFQIFRSCSAVLVSLYLSPFTGNKDCADSSVRHFLTSCRNTLSVSLHAQCARVVLEFCTLLRVRGRVIGSEDPLYLFCRSTLGSLLETARVSCAASEIDNAKEEIIFVQDILPFVRELAKRLLVDLDLSMISPSTVGTLFNNVGDFTAFLIPLRKGIMEQQALKDVLLVGEVEEDLLGLYNDLLSKIDQCLQYLGQRWAGHEMMQRDDHDLDWSHYLSILKELYLISKLYDGAEEKLWNVLMCHRSVLCLLIVRYAKRTGEHQWILEHKPVTDFESRRHLAMLMFPEVMEDYEEMYEMLIDRSQLLSESFEYIARADPESLKAGLFIKFKNEEVTGPSVVREWFLLVCQAIFNPQNALFLACPHNPRRFYPNPASKVNPQHLEYFSFCGRVIALALMHRVQVGIVLDRVFFLQLAGKYVTLEDIKDADPNLYTRCKQILDMDSDFIDSDALGLTFVREAEELGHTKVVELYPGGENLVVNSKNREMYIDLLIRDRFVTSTSEQVSYFAHGFADILSSSKLQQFFFQSLELEDLDWMLRGSQDFKLGN